MDRQKEQKVVAVWPVFCFICGGGFGGQQCLSLPLFF
jgi:hypothetical protein